ncbi:hypothetical protein HK100_009011 [Physocladia obscura]|uniref:Cutinase n=1 Tax=Physocladia obscura TaxID=109957 RepID=A0AAD5SMJ2_9FUNG|nr:hypothetical protein HK100_009011 [Physocladia obscura]
MADFNDVLNGVCKALTIIFARGTTESGNVGESVGPFFISAIQNELGAANVAAQGVSAPAYAADIPGFLQGGSPTGSVEMAQLVAQTVTQCPQTQIVLSGYSQGGQLVHNAAAMLTAKQIGAISSAVIFGDPDNGTAVANVPASKTLVVCHPTDNICQHGDLILPAHLDYEMDVPNAAKFVANAATIASTK